MPFLAAAPAQPAGRLIRGDVQFIAHAETKRVGLARVRGVRRVDAGPPSGDEVSSDSGAFLDR